MSVNGLQQTYIPPTLDGLNVVEADQIYIDGTLVNLDDLVPYQGASKTVDLGSQPIKTTYTATQPADLVNKALLDYDLSTLSVLVEGEFLSKNKVTSQTVVGPVTFQSVITSTAGLKLESLTSGHWTITVEYIDAYTQNLVFTSSAGAVIRFTGDYGFLKSTGWTPQRVMIVNSSGELVSSSVTTTTLSYLDATSSIQTQLNNKADASALSNYLPLSGGTMTGAIAMGTFKITSSAVPSTGNDFTNKTYVDTAVGSIGALYLPLAGGTLTGNFGIVDGKTTNLSDALKVNQTALSYTASSLVTTGLPSGVQGGTISLTYRLTATSGQASMGMTLSGFTYAPSNVFTYTFTGVQASTALTLQVVQNSSVNVISVSPVSISTSAGQTITGSFIMANTGGTIAFVFQAGVANPYVNWTGFTLTRGDTEVTGQMVCDDTLTVAGATTLSSTLTTKTTTITQTDTEASSNSVLTLLDSASIPHKLWFLPNLAKGYYNTDIQLGDFGIISNADNDGASGSGAIAIGPWNGTNLLRIEPTQTVNYGNLIIGSTTIKPAPAGFSASINIQSGTGDGNIYAFAFNADTGSYNCGFGPVSTSRGILGPTLYTMAHHVSANAEWGVFSDGWRNCFSVKGGTGEWRTNTQFISTNDPPSNQLGGYCAITAGGANTSSGYWIGIDSGGTTWCNSLAPSVSWRSWRARGYDFVWFPSGGGQLAINNNGNVYVQKFLTVDGGCKIVVQNGTDGGPNDGIWMWTNTDSNWGIYMGQAGYGRSLSAANPVACAGYGFQSHAIRFRVYNNTSNGFIFENSDNGLAASIRSDGVSYFSNNTTITGRVSVGPSVDGSHYGHFNIRNPNGSYSHFGSTDGGNTNYIRGRTIVNSGYFEIGDSYVWRAPLDITTNVSRDNGCVRYFDVWGGLGYTCNWYSYSAMADTWGGARFMAYSDIRKKKNIQPVVNALQALDDIRIVSYDHIDAAQPPNYWGVIAQEVEEKYPHLITTGKEFLPNIYKDAIAHHCTECGCFVWLEMEDKQDEKMVGKAIRLYTFDTEEKKEYEEHTDVVKVEGKRIKVKRWKKAEEDRYVAEEKVFVYGTCEDDVRTVDKSQFGLLAVASCQELKRQVKDQEDKIKKLEENLEKVASLIAQLLK